MKLYLFIEGVARFARPHAFIRKGSSAHSHTLPALHWACAFMTSCPIILLNQSTVQDSSLAVSLVRGSSTFTSLDAHHVINKVKVHVIPRITTAQCWSLWPIECCACHVGSSLGRWPLCSWALLWWRYRRKQATRYPWASQKGHCKYLRNIAECAKKSNGRCDLLKSDLTSNTTEKEENVNPHASKQEKYRW